MSGFSNQQLKALAATLPRDAVHTRTVDGRSLHYIEGWFALAQANAIFGYGGWDREMAQFERVYERVRGELTACGYMARVRIRVRAGDKTIVREGTGFGAANARSPADAHERALKAAETDATKRALATFGNRFGLCLYDKDQAGVGDGFKLLAPDGSLLAANLSPEGYCSGLRQLAEATRTAGDIDGLLLHNRGAIAQLRERAPSLRNGRGEHYADILLRLLSRRQADLRPAEPPQQVAPAGPGDAGQDRFVSAIPVSAGEIEDSASEGIGSVVLAEPAPAAAVELPDAQAGTMDGLQPPHDIDKAPPIATESSQAREDRDAGAPPKPSKIGEGDSVDKSALRFGHERRLRDKEHLKRVAELPCVVCNRQPSHAHHVKFAQRRGLSQKVSDEFVVPLCALHHGDLHRPTTERDWWARQALDPLPIAAELWAERDATRSVSS